MGGGAQEDREEKGLRAQRRYVQVDSFVNLGRGDSWGFYYPFLTIGEGREVFFIQVKWGTFNIIICRNWWSLQETKRSLFRPLLISSLWLLGQEEKRAREKRQAERRGAHKLQLGVALMGFFPMGSCSLYKVARPDLVGWKPT